MKSFDLKLGFTCNNNCIHCVISDKRTNLKRDSGSYDLSTSEVKKTINSLKDKTRIVLTGGEPTIREDFVEIIDYINSKGHVINIQTNGTGLADEEVVKKINGKVEHVLIAIHSFKEHTHNKIVGDSTGKMYKQTIKGLDNIIKNKINCSTQTVLSSYNIQDLYETYDSLQKKYPGITMHMTYPHLMGNAYKNKDIVAIKYSDIRSQIHKCLKHYGKLIMTEAIPFCYLFPYENDIILNYDLESTIIGVSSGLDPSLRKTKSDLLSQDGIMIDYGIANIKDRRKAAKCKECLFNEACPGVWKEYIEKYKNELDLFPIREDSGAIIVRYDECDSTCSFCSGGYTLGWEKDKNKFINNVKNNINFFIERKFNIIEISGEPSENDTTVEFVKHAYDGRISSIVISTHGRGFKDEGFVRRLSEAGASAAKIPIYGPNKEIHEKTQWSKDKSRDPFAETLMGIENCIKNGMRIIGSTLVNRNNKDSIIDIFNLYIELSKDSPSKFSEFDIVLGGIAIKEYKFTSDWYLPVKEVGPILRDFIDSTEEKAAKNDINIIVLDIPYCAFGRYDYRIICGHTAPNLGADFVPPFLSSEQSNKVPHYRVKEHFEDCKKCKYIGICAGWPKNDLEMFGNYGVDTKRFHNV